MKPICLVNPSLINAVIWYNKADSYFKDKAYNDLLRILVRAPYKEPTPSQQAGIELEKWVNKYVHTTTSPNRIKHSKEFITIVERVLRANTQVFHTKDIDGGGCIYRVYGILDYEFSSQIIDLKTTANFVESYYHGPQDILYRWLTYNPHTNFIKDFEYLVAVWAEGSLFKIGEIRRILCAPFIDYDYLYSEVLYSIDTLVNGLKDLDLYDLWVDCYSHNGKGWKSEIARKGPNQAKALEEFYKPYWDKYLAEDF
jgi:hypothetical protein